MVFRHRVIAQLPNLLWLHLFYFGHDSAAWASRVASILRAAVNLEVLVFEGDSHMKAGVLGEKRLFC